MWYIGYSRTAGTSKQNSTDVILYSLYDSMVNHVFFKICLLTMNVYVVMYCPQVAQTITLLKCPLHLYHKVSFHCVHYWRAERAFLVLSTGDFYFCTVHTIMLYVLLIIILRAHSHSPTMHSIQLVMI